MEIIANYIYDSGVLIVNLNSKWKNLEEFILEAKKNPRKITLGNNGIGMSNHLGGIMLENEAGIEFIHTPFSSSSDILEALEKGYIDAAIVKISEVGDVNRKFQILASFTEERLEIIEDIPTLKEKGYDVILGSTRAFVVPKGIPRQILEKLREIFKKGICSYENRENFKKIGLNIKWDIVSLDPPKLAPSKRDLDKALKAYKDIILNGIKLTNKGGLLAIYSCSGAVTSNDLRMALAYAVKDAGVKATIIHQLHQSSCHPISVSVPETEYLKGFLVRII